jgi:glycosyltransferase involved in cell wall biosynthesis
MFTEGRFYWDGGTRHFTISNWGKAIVSEYAQTFDNIHIFCRCSLMDLDSIPPTEIIDLPNVSFTHLPNYRRLHGYLWYRRQLFRQIREDLGDGDVCFMRVPNEVSSAGIKVARSLGIPIVCQLVGDAQMVFGTDETLVPTRFLRRIASTIAFHRQQQDTNRCQAQIAISKELARKFCRHPEVVPIIPNTKVTDEAFLSFRVRDPTESFNALFVGRLEHHKNVQLFLYALAELRRQGRNVRTTIVGGGRYLPFLTRLANKLHITSAVYFAGRIYSREELLEYYRHAHMLYLLSLTEGLGSVLMEAGAASLPIIGSRVGGIPEIAREGENAFLIEPDDVHGCAEAVKRLLDDEALRERMGRRSQEIARLYTVKNVVARGAEVLRSVLNKG